MNEPSHVMAALKSYGPSSLYGNNSFESLLCCLLSLRGDTGDSRLIAEIAELSRGRPNGAATKQGLVKYLDQLRSVVAKFIPMMQAPNPLVCSESLKKCMLPRPLSLSEDGKFIRSVVFPVLNELGAKSPGTVLRKWSALIERYGRVNLVDLSDETFALLAALAKQEMDVEDRQLLLKIWCEASESPLNVRNLLTLVLRCAWFEWPAESLSGVSSLAEKLPELKLKQGVLSLWEQERWTELVVPDISSGDCLIAAKGGDVFVAYKDCGLFKIGMGRGPNILGMNFRKDISARPSGIAVTNCGVLLRCPDDDKIHMYDRRDLSHIGTIENVETPSGVFTALGDRVYFVENQQINIYLVQNLELHHERTVDIDRQLVIDGSCVEILCDGEILYFVSRTNADSTIERITKAKGVSVLTGQIVVPEQLLPHGVEHVCCDCDSNTIVTIDKFGRFRLSLVNESVMLNTSNEFPFVKVLTSCISLIDMGFNQMGNLDIVFGIVKKSCELKHCEMINTVAVLLISLLDYNIDFLEEKLVNEILELLTCELLDHRTRLHLTTKIVRHPYGHGLVNDQSFWEKVLGFFKPVELAVMFPGELSLTLVNLMLCNPTYTRLLHESCRVGDGGIWLLRIFLDNLIVYLSRKDLDETALVKFIDMLHFSDPHDFEFLVPGLSVALSALPASSFENPSVCGACVRILVKLLALAHAAIHDLSHLDQTEKVIHLTDVVPVVLTPQASSFSIRKTGCDRMKLVVFNAMSRSVLSVRKAADETPQLVINSTGEFEIETNELHLDLNVDVLPMTMNTELWCIIPFARCYHPSYLQDILSLLSRVLFDTFKAYLETCKVIEWELILTIFKGLYALQLPNVYPPRYFNKFWPLIHDDHACLQYLCRKVSSGLSLRIGEMIVLSLSMFSTNIPKEWKEVGYAFLQSIGAADYSRVRDVQHIIRDLSAILGRDDGLATVIKPADQLMATTPQVAALYVISVIEGAKNLDCDILAHVLLRCLPFVPSELIPRLLFCASFCSESKIQLRQVDKATVVDVLRTIGDSIQDHPGSLLLHISFRSVALAYAFRLLIDVNGYGILTDVLTMDGTDALLGLLTVLAVNYFGTHTGVICRMHSDGRNVVVTESDVSTLTVIDQFGISMKLPLDTLQSQVGNSFPLEMKKVDHIGPVTEEFITLICRHRDGNVDNITRLAKFSLAEISYNNDVSGVVFQELISSTTIEGSDETNKLVEETFSRGFHGEFQVVLRLQATSLCGFKIQAGRFGIIDASEHSNWDTMEFCVDGEQCSQYQLKAGSCVRLLLRGQDRQLILQIDGKLYITQHYYGHLVHPSLYFLLDSKDDLMLLPDEATFPSFVLPGIAHIGRKFSHVLADGDLSRIVNWNRIFDRRKSFHLLPAIHVRDTCYLEISTSSSATVTVMNDVASCRIYFCQKIDVPKSAVIGLLINKHTSSIHILLNNSVYSHRKHVRIDSCSVKIDLEDPDHVQFNCGEYPFAYSECVKELSEHLQPDDAESNAVELINKPQAMDKRETVPDFRTMYASARNTSEQTKLLESFLASTTVFIHDLSDTSEGLLHEIHFRQFNRLQDNAIAMALVVNLLSGFFQKYSKRLDSLEEFVVTASRYLETPRLLDAMPSEEMRRIYAVLWEKASDIMPFVIRASQSVNSDGVKTNGVIVRKQSRPMFTRWDLCHIALDSNALSPTIVIRGPSGNEYILNRSQYSQISIPGPYFIANSCDTNYLSVLDLVSLRLHEKDWAYGLGFISFLVSIARENADARTLLMNEIIMPLYRDIMSGKTILFTASFGRWFYEIMKWKAIDTEHMLAINELTNFDALLLMADPALAVPITLFSAFCWTNCTTDLSIVRAKLVDFVSRLTQPDVSGAAVSVAMQIGYKLLDRRNDLHILGRVDELVLPVVTRVALGAVAISGPSEDLTELRVEGHNKTRREYRWANADKVFVHLGSGTTSVHINEVKVTDDTLIDGSSVAVDIEESDAVQTLWVTPYTLPQYATVMDAQNVLRMYLLMTAMSEPDEVRCAMMAAKLHASVFQNEKPTLCGFPDSAFAAMECDADVARFRVALHLVMLSRKQTHFVSDAYPDLDEFLMSHSDCIGHNGTTDGGLRLYSDWHYSHLFASTGIDKSGALLPIAKATTPSELHEFAGFGKDMALLVAAGRRVPLPLSCVVIRSAFGGSLLAEDFADVDPVFAQSEPTKDAISGWLQPYLHQLQAIRAGVLQSGIHFCPSKIFPKVVEMLPLNAD